MRIVLLLCCLSFFLQACLKKDNLLVKSKIEAPKIQLVSAAAFFDASVADSVGLTIEWNAADYGPKTQVNYTVEITTAPADFEKAKGFDTGSELQKAFTIGELNSFYCKMAAPRGSPCPYLSG